MTSIIEEAEKHYWPQIEVKRPKAANRAKTFQNDLICFNACRVAEEIGAVGIVGLTVSGYTAFKMSSFRPQSRIFIFSDQRHILNTLNLLWGRSSASTTTRPFHLPMKQSRIVWISSKTVSL